MPAFNFHESFASAVESEAKTQTIRSKRKQRPRVGQMAYCFAGMRTRKCRRLWAWPIRAVADVRIDEAGVILNGAALRAEDLDAFARADGFGHWEGMLNWFRSTHGLPFHGDLISWRNASEQARVIPAPPAGCSAWISVKDSLPDDARDVLTLGHFGVHKACFEWGTEDDPCWWTNEVRKAAFKESVTHWAELPNASGQPPAAQEKP